jgi:lysophospholipase L1-like esterase
MIRPRNSFLLLLTALAILIPRAASAQVDFTRYVAIGDSLTAGYNSGGLVQDVQRNSYPALIFRAATGSSTGFEQPLVTRPGLPPLLELRDLSPLIIAPRAGQGQPANLNLQRPYNNLAVPGARIHDVIATVHSDTNPLFDLVLRGLGTELQQAVALRPTFVTVWIGNNDALNAVLSGRVIEGVTLTPAAQFEADLRTILDTLASTGAKIVVGEVIPGGFTAFANAIPPIVINPATSRPVLINGLPVPLIGPAGPLDGGDKVLLTAAAKLAQGIGIPAALGGTGLPLADSDIFDGAEQRIVSERVAQYNAIIHREADARGAGTVTFLQTLSELSRGIEIGGISYSLAFLTGGVFSYDGVHPTAFGYAFLANRWIRAINDKFGSEVRPVNLGPFVFGPEGSAGTQAEFAPLGGDSFIWTAAADAALRAGLGIPSNTELSRYRRAPAPDPPDGPTRNKPPRDGKRHQKPPAD